jgi:2-polyprenyl-6-methoxyphenol hydroxylase-like FAD-dependent oxidoreductase
MYYVPGSGQSTEPGHRLLAWGCNLPVPADALPSVLVDDQGRQQSSSVPFGRVHPQLRADFEARLADLLPPLLFELVQQSASPSVHALYSVMPRRYARDRLCLVGDAGAVFPPFTGSGVLKAVGNATFLVDALADASAVDDALQRWSQAQLEVAAEVMPTSELIERKYVFGMPDLAAMPAAAANDWMFSAFSGFGVTLPDA